jgi:hypothetical protein
LYAGMRTAPVVTKRILSLEKVLQGQGQMHGQYDSIGSSKGTPIHSPQGSRSPPVSGQTIRSIDRAIRPRGNGIDVSELKGRALSMGGTGMHMGMGSSSQEDIQGPSSEGVTSVKHWVTNSSSRSHSQPNSYTGSHSNSRSNSQPNSLGAYRPSARTQNLPLALVECIDEETFESSKRLSPAERYTQNVKYKDEIENVKQRDRKSPDSIPPPCVTEETEKKSKVPPAEARHGHHDGGKDSNSIGNRDRDRDRPKEKDEESTRTDVEEKISTRFEEEGIERIKPTPASLIVPLGTRNRRPSSPRPKGVVLSRGHSTDCYDSPRSSPGNLTFLSLFRSFPHTPNTDPDSGDAARHEEDMLTLASIYSDQYDFDNNDYNHQTNALYIAKQSAGEPPQPKGAFTRPFPLPLPRNLDGKLKKYANADPPREH